MKKIFSFGFVFLLVFVFGFTAPIHAEDDTTPPTGTISINDGALYTNTRDVILTLSATDDTSDVTEMEMKFNNGTGTYSDPETYSTTKSWTLSASGDGLKTVRVKFIDQAGNENTPGIPATITLDTVIPVITLVESATMELSVGEIYEDAGATALDNDVNDLTSSIVTVNPVDVNTAGTYVITYDVTDLAGNSATQVTRTVTVIDDEEPEPEGDIEEDPPLLVEENIVLKNGCTVEDNEGEMHIFPQDDSPSEYLAICAFQEALEQGFVDDIEFVDFGFGLFVNSVNNVSEENTYWQLRKNDISADVGASELTLEANDVVSLVLTSFDPDTFEETTLDDSVKLTIESLSPEEEEVPPPPAGGGGGGGGGDDAPDTFDIEDALAYLKSVQAGDGSFGGALLYTDWAGVAFGALDVADSAKDLLLSYLSSHNEISSLLTDNERRAMALLALGENPYDFNGINYIKAITDSFDGTQFGDENLVNDDIFALIPLVNTGYDEDDEIITKAVAFIISKQKANGSWEESVDVTAAGIQALKSFDTVDGVSEALSEAEDYLVNEQENTGGWEDSVFSTSWAMQAMNALNESWEKNGNTPEEYLASKQVADGAVSPSEESLANRIWATSYAIAGASGKSWSEIMQNVSKQDEEGGGENNSSSEKSENPTPPKAEDPVVCPVGDLFSTVTGQACTAFVETTPIVLDVPLVIQNIDIPSENSANQNSSTTSQTEEFPEETEEVENIEITPEGLTASVTNAVSSKSIPPAIPIAVGAVSGLALLYFVSKFFFL